MENIIINKKVLLEELGLPGTLIIYSIAKEAINKGWESLYYSTNEETFASIEIGDYFISLDTNGEVKIISEQDEELSYGNKDIQEIRAIIDNNQLDDYIVDNNNWFSLSIGKIVKKEANGTILSETIDDVVFEACPESIEELEKQLIEYASWLYKNYAAKK